MISGIDSTLGLKLFHGAVVHTLGQLLSAQMQAAMGMDVNNARVVTMGRRDGRARRGRGQQRVPAIRCGQRGPTARRTPTWEARLHTG